MTSLRLVLAGLLLATSPLLASCGGEETTATDAPADSSQAATGDEAFQQCLADQGVELPEAGASPDLSGLDPAALQEAMGACGDLAAPEGFPGGPGGAGAGAPDPTALKAFAKCLKKRDVKVEPDLASIQQLDRTDPKVTKAFDACAGLIGQ